MSSRSFFTQTPGQGQRGGFEGEAAGRPNENPSDFRGQKWMDLPSLQESWKPMGGFSRSALSFWGTPRSSSSIVGMRVWFHCASRKKELARDWGQRKRGAPRALRGLTRAPRLGEFFEGFQVFLGPLFWMPKTPVPFLTRVFFGRVPRLKQSLEKKGYPSSNLCTGGPRCKASWQE